MDLEVEVRALASMHCICDRDRNTPDFESRPPKLLFLTNKEKIMKNFFLFVLLIRYLPQTVTIPELVQ